MSDGSHLLIPFASCGGDAGARARQGLALPHLDKLLARLRPAARDDGAETDLSMPYERVLAREFGISAPDGCIPWAACEVAQSGRDTGGDAWAWITPCHWRVGRDHIAMGHPHELALQAQESQALLAAMQPYFAQDGITLAYDAPTRWLARGAIFEGFASASLDRVIGTVVDPWLPRAAQARTIRRLQQEMQMLLYTHTVNEERGRGGQLPVNSFWVSGTGALPAQGMPQPPAGLQITHSLRDVALLQDWHGWSAAWQQVDGRECAQLLRDLGDGRAVSLTLCGDRNAVTWSGQGGGLLRNLGAALRGGRAESVLENL
jgi:hypothetical protein